MHENLINNEIDRRRLGVKRRTAGNLRAMDKGKYVM